MVRTSSMISAARRPAPVAATTAERRLRRLVAENVRLTRELKELRRLRRWAHESSLTALPNRRSFEERLDEELLRWERDPGQYGAILVVDTRDMKWKDAGLGPTGGDAALQETVRVLRGALRASDVCCRTGRAEFMVLLPETSDAGARQAMARMRSCVMRAGARQDLPLSIGLGMSSWPADGRLASVLIRSADRAMDAERGRLAAWSRRRPPRAPKPLALIR